eukprot:1162005-Pelagomonas_calceolata.AAC.5
MAVHGVKGTVLPPEPRLCKPQACRWSCVGDCPLRCTKNMADNATKWSQMVLTGAVPIQGCSPNPRVHTGAES